MLTLFHPKFPSTQGPKVHVYHFPRLSYSNSMIWGVAFGTGRSFGSVVNIYEMMCSNMEKIKNV